MILDMKMFSQDRLKHWEMKGILFFAIQQAEQVKCFVCNIYGKVVKYKSDSFTGNNKDIQIKDTCDYVFLLLLKYSNYSRDSYLNRP